jgi:hypothetical protein
VYNLGHECEEFTTEAHGKVRSVGMEHRAQGVELEIRGQKSEVRGQ